MLKPLVKSPSVTGLTLVMRTNEEKAIRLVFKLRQIHGLVYIVLIPDNDVNEVRYAVGHSFGCVLFHSFCRLFDRPVNLTFPFLRKWRKQDVIPVHFLCNQVYNNNDVIFDSFLHSSTNYHRGEYVYPRPVGLGD